MKSEASPCSTCTLKENCVHYYKGYPLHVLRSNVLSSSNYLLSGYSDEGTDIANDHSSIQILTCSENGQYGSNLQQQNENGEEQQNSVRDLWRHQ